MIFVVPIFVVFSTIRTQRGSEQRMLSQPFGDAQLGGPLVVVRSVTGKTRQTSALRIKKNGPSNGGVNEPVFCVWVFLRSSRY